jgi:hypothetical protein
LWPIVEKKSVAGCRDQLIQADPHRIEDHAIAERSSGEVLGNGVPGFKNVDEPLGGTSGHNGTDSFMI